MLIKLKLPERKETIHKLLYREGFNDALQEVESMNQPLVRGMEIDMEIDVEELAKICHSNSGASRMFSSYWDCMGEQDKDVFRREAKLIKANAHVWLKEVEKV